MSTPLEREAALERSPSVMMRLRLLLHPYRRYLKWLRCVARWQMCYLPVQSLTQHRFARWVNLLTADPGEEAIWRFPGTPLRFVLQLEDHIQSGMYYAGPFQPEVVRVFARHIRPDRLFVDLGTHIGQYTLLAADYYRRKGRGAHPMVFAFEPDPLIFQHLQRNIALNSLEQYISAHNLAVSDQDGVAIFHLAGAANSGSGSLAAFDSSKSFHAQTGETLEVTTVMLDNFFQQRNADPVGLIKADIEGAELLALRGARQILCEHRPVLILEAHSELMKDFGYGYADLHDLLIALSYSIYRIQSDGGLVRQTDTALPSGSHDLLCLPQDYGC